MGYTKDQLLARLRELEVDFTCYEHPPVLTVEAQAKYVGHLGGALSKNLLLKDKKSRLYIVSALANTRVDLKILSARLGLGKGGLRMAPEEALQEVLQVPPGCVTPFAVINESASVVSLLLDQGFKSQHSCYFHPLTNDVTIALSTSDLDKFLQSIGRQPAYADLEANPSIDKDNPPDLAFVVPSEAASFSAVDDKTPSHAPDQNNVTKQKPTSTQEAKKDHKSKSGGVDKVQITASQPVEILNVEKFVTEVLEKISPVFFSEICKKSNVEPEELPESSILDGVRTRVTSDLESMTMILKNTAYTEGFSAGFDAMLKFGLNGRPSRGAETISNEEK